MVNSLNRPQYEFFRKMVVRARQLSGLTQVQVAAGLGRPQSFVSKYERGERRLDFTEFVEIANVLGIDAGQFLATYQESVDCRRLLRRPMLPPR